MAAAAPLTATHRQAQLALRAGVLRDLQKLWPAMDWTDLDRTFPLWATAIGALVTKNRHTSASLAAAYYRAFRFAAGITDTAPIILAQPVDPTKLAISLQVTALAGAKAAAARGVTREVAMANAFVRSSGAVTRLVLEGGRETIRETVAADPRARGWERVTGARSCGFCRLLASRGGVFKATTADFQAHDHCGCTAQPVYR